MSTALSQYERTALQEINDWKSPEEQTWFGALPMLCLILSIWQEMQSCQFQEHRLL